MSKLKFNFSLIIFVCCSVLPFNLCGQTTITGEVFSIEDSLPLQGATIRIPETKFGTISDENGQFSLNVDIELPIRITVSHIGFQTQNLEIHNTEELIRVLLIERPLAADEVVISASRIAEELIMTPSSVSILDQFDLQSEAVSHPVQSLRNIMGVQINEQGLFTHSITLRGVNQLLSTETLVMLDYRKVNTGASSVSFLSKSPIHEIDLEKVEVVRGPGSALWGPGVEAGVVHFISKNPFDYPGTTVSMTGGERGSFAIASRHAGKLNEKLGYKFLAFYKRANDWQLDLTDSIDIAHSSTFVDKFVTSDGNVFAELEGNILPNTFNWNISGLLEYRINSNSSISMNAGYGFLQNTYRQNTSEWYGSNGNPFGQIRYKSKDFFIQANWFREIYDEKSFLYRTGIFSTSTVDTYDAQMQYSESFLGNRSHLTLGGDYRLIRLNTTIAGRFTEEALNGYLVYGAYIQNVFDFNKILSLTTTARIDRFEVINQTSFSPRIALVFRPQEKHALRLTYNRAIGTPNAFDSWIDLTVGRSPLFNTQLVGGAASFNFTNTNQTVSTLNFSSYEGIGLPLSIAYDMAIEGLQNSQTDEVIEYLRNLDISGFSNGRLVLNGQTITNLVSKSPVTTTSSTTFEVGYNGLISNNLKLQVDLYYTNRGNFIFGPSPINPFVFAPNIKTDLHNQLEQLLDSTVLFNLGTNKSEIINLFDNFSEGLTNRPIGLIEPDEALDPNSPELIITYLNSGEISYFGADFGLNYQLYEKLNFYFNYSFLSKNIFNDDDLNVPASGRILTFNLPRHRFVIGGGINSIDGFHSDLSVKYIGRFESANGPIFSGINESYTVLDANIGYSFRGKWKGFSVNLTSTNLLNQKYRPIPGTPKIGRLTLLNLTYHM